MPRCPHCDDGYTVIDEDGRRVRHPCYACNTEGVVSDDYLSQMRLSAAAMTLADGVVGKKMRLAEMEPDFDGWGFIAAEGHTTISQIRLERAEVLGRKYFEILEQLREKEPALVEQLLNYVVPLPADTNELVVAVAPAPEAMISDDIPF